MSQLPIDEILPQALAHLRRPKGATLIVEAAPGAGKTTRLPKALLHQSWCTGKVLVSEPRRAAARLSAQRVAEEMGCALGAEVGYQVRFDEKVSKKSRLVYLTEGLLLRRWQSDPTLSEVSALVLDEVHERSATLDLLMALALRLQRERSDLRLILMSATLDADKLSEYFQGAARLQSRGRSFPVEIHHAPARDDRPLSIQVRSAVREALSHPGDALVFLPGAREIRDCQTALQKFEGLRIDTLHGEMSMQDQARVLRAPRKEKRVILSTNIAESSLTIVGVTTVIDSGLARVARFDAWAGVQQLETVEISQARAIQRAGRAGRVAAGRALRLYSRSSFAARPPQDLPEIETCDLSELLLTVHFLAQSSGFAWSSLKWLSPPPAGPLAQAIKLLTDLGALDGGKLTAWGRKMAQLPLSPRLACVALCAHKSGLAVRGSLAVALLSERDIFLRDDATSAIDPEAGDSDLEERLDRFEHLRAKNFAPRVARQLNLDVRSCREMVRASDSIQAALRRLGELKDGPPIDSSLAPQGDLSQALVHGFFDRVAYRAVGSNKLILSTGVQASLSRESCVLRGDLLLAVKIDRPSGRSRSPVVRIAVQLDPNLLFTELPSRIEAEDRLTFNAAQGRVDALSQLRFGKVILDESLEKAAPSPEVAQILFEAAWSRGLSCFDEDEGLQDLIRRLALLADYSSYLSGLSAQDTHFMQLATSSPERLIQQFLLGACQTRTNLEQLREADLALELAAEFSPVLAAALRREVPEKVRLKGGRLLKVVYGQDRPPLIQSRLQDFFSMTKTPSICFGEVPLSLHLLAPNQRAVQVTSDLQGFWQRHYPELRRQLMRRYPKHLWPEDGATAQPPTPGRIR